MLQQRYQGGERRETALPIHWQRSASGPSVRPGMGFIGRCAVPEVVKRPCAGSCTRTTAQEDHRALGVLAVQEMRAVRAVFRMVNVLALSDTIGANLVELVEEFVTFLYTIMLAENFVG